MDHLIEWRASHFAQLARRLSRSPESLSAASISAPAVGCTSRMLPCGASVARRPPGRPSPGVHRKRDEGRIPAAAPLSAWAILALAGGDAPFLKQVAGLLSDPDRSRARSRLQRLGLLSPVPRLRGRATTRMFLVPFERFVELLAEMGVVLSGSSAARLLGWALPEGTWPSASSLAG